MFFYRAEQSRRQLDEAKGTVQRLTSRVEDECRRRDAERRAATRRRRAAARRHAAGVGRIRALADALLTDAAADADDADDVEEEEDAPVDGVKEEAPSDETLRR